MKNADINILTRTNSLIDATNVEKLEILLSDSKDALGTVFKGILFIKKCSDDLKECKQELKAEPDDEDLIENEESTREMFNYVLDETLKLAIHTGDTEILEYMEDQGIPYSHFSDRSSAKEYAIENGNTEIQAFYVNMFKRMAEKLGECNQALIRQNLFIEQKKSQIARIEMKAALAIAQTNEEVTKEIDSKISDMYSKVAI